MRRYQKILALTLVGTGAFMLPGTLPVQATTVQAGEVQAGAAIHGLQKVTAVTRVYGSGEQVAEAILEYPKALFPSAVKPTDYAVSGKEITAVMVNDKPELTDKSQAGRYVILQFAKQNNVYDGDLSKKPGRQARPADDKNGQGTDAPRQSNRKMPDLSLQVQQVRPLTAIDGTTFTSLTVSATAVNEPNLERFQQYEYTDKEVGATIPYNLYLPQNYDPKKKYPLLFFVADASANINAIKTPLFQGNGATIWASDSEQGKHECIILAPQYTADLVDKIGMMTTDENVWTPGLTLVTNLLHDVIERYSVDKNRIYGTGQSQGGMANIAISDKYPDLFAAQWLVACQWNVKEMAAMKDKKLWITVCEGDTKAFPGMNAATALWESLGSKVARNKEFWNSNADMAEINAKVKDLANGGAPINYTVFAGGNHMYTWSFAYDIETIRDWLFEQRKYKTDHNQHNIFARAIQDAGVAAYKAGDYPKALQNFYAADKKGHMKAPRYIGICYENGYGVKPDAKVAAKWYEKAVSRGDITGTYYLGRLYELGKGVPQDYGKAVELYRKSAQRGDIIAAPAMAALGRMYENGLGLAKDMDTAQMYYDKAKATGYTN
ncbi:SEL1-like repeat protein [Selenomonas ruminantium]|uniref:Predicted peptidase n=1 Tax=Selenomonas ruminantium TaxID=971 RepID=A0A1K1MEM2_SELRU|nr:SEL1-like repeat protein [Selenomonas ruminantium]SFW21564.1 Predicted peptidase [Selenomonas ruminantium]